MKNCGSFYVYNLSYTDECNQAYCFGKFFLKKYMFQSISVFGDQNVDRSICCMMHELTMLLYMYKTSKQHYAS